MLVDSVVVDGGWDAPPISEHQSSALANEALEMDDEELGVRVKTSRRAILDSWIDPAGEGAEPLALLAKLASSCPERGPLGSPDSAFSRLSWRLRSSSESEYPSS